MDKFTGGPQPVQQNRKTHQATKGHLMQSRKPTTRIAEWSATHRKLAIFGWLAFVVAAVAIGGSIGTKTLDGADLSTGEAQRAERALERADLKPNSEVVLLQNTDLTVGDEQFSTVVGQVTTGLEETRFVDGVSSPSNGGGAISEDGHSALIEFEIAGDSTQAETRVDTSLAAVNAVRKANPDYTVRQFGDASANKAINQVFADDLKQAETLSLPITLIILVIAFGSLVAAGVPLLLAISAVAATIGLVAIPSQFFPVDESLTSVILLVGLAVGVDYSLFYLRREREERAAGRSPEESLAKAAMTSGKAILVSGLTVMVAMAGLLITGDSTFISFAIGTVMVVGVAMFASLTVLPALLSWLGDRVEKGRVPFTRTAPPTGRRVALLGRAGQPGDAASGDLDRGRGRRTAGPRRSGPRTEHGSDRSVRFPPGPAGGQELQQDPGGVPLGGITVGRGGRGR